jgi:trehalose monomycolate/heme transporter
LTWIFVDGHFSTWLNFTPAPLMVVLIALVVAVGFGLATDYEVFLVSRMVEARARGMSTAEAIRIGTATTGRLITAAALVLGVVAGSFIFSDLVMMKCLAFGLMAALLLDAAIIRMFLVPSVMKLLGDDCWWAPMWMKRLQNRLGLGEIHLPDERKLPSPRARSSRPATTRPPVTSTPRPPHDPTHPSAEGAPGPSRPAAVPPRPDLRPPAPDTPSAAGTTRMPAPGRPEPKEAPTTRFSAQPNPSTGRPPAPPQGPPQPARGEDREIESWLSDLRGGKTGDPRGAGPTPPQPSADETRALQIPRDQSSGQPPAEPADATTAIPTPPRDEKDSDTATEKLNARGENPPRRRGGGLSAADLLRREGRM